MVSMIHKLHKLFEQGNPVNIGLVRVARFVEGLSREGRLAMCGCPLDPVRLPGIVHWVHVLPSLTSTAGVFSKYPSVEPKASKRFRRADPLQIPKKNFFSLFSFSMFPSK
jgi:hypothetical protein